MRALEKQVTVAYLCGREREISRSANPACFCFRSSGNYVAIVFLLFVRRRAGIALHSVFGFIAFEQ